MTVNQMFPHSIFIGGNLVSVGNKIKYTYECEYNGKQTRWGTVEKIRDTHCAPILNSSKWTYDAKRSRYLLTIAHKPCEDSNSIYSRVYDGSLIVESYALDSGTIAGLCFLISFATLAVAAWIQFS